MGTTTTNFNLYKPAVGEVGWGDLRNTSYDTIDGQMFTNQSGISTNVTAIGLNTDHRGADGSSHIFIDQDVINGASPFFLGTNITQLGAVNVNITDAGALITATEVEAALQENRTIIDANEVHAASLPPHRLINDVGTSATDLWSAQQISSVVQGIDWKESVISFFDPTAGTPVGPTTGDRYISEATANGWTLDSIFQWNGASWDETVPNEGAAAWVEDEDTNYTFNGTNWVKFGTTVDHVNLQNIGTNTHVQIDTHIGSDGSDHSLVVSNQVSSINFLVDGGGSVITTGAKGFIEIPFDCTINRWTMVSDQSCTATMDVNRQTFAAFDGSPPSIVGGSSVPTITAALKGQDTDISDWTSVLVTDGDILGFDVDSNDNATRITIALQITKT
jgi:hypothetical protein